MALSLADQMFVRLALERQWLSEQQVRVAVRILAKCPYLSIREILLGAKQIPFPRYNELMHMVSKKTRLGEMCVEFGLMEAEELADAIADQRRSRQVLGEILVARGYITARQLDRMLMLQAARREVDADEALKGLDLAR